MFDSNLLDIVIGLVFVYFILSIITTAITEIVSNLMALRGRNLQTGVQTLLSDLNNTGLAEDFYEHPLIKSLARPGGKPSYIASNTFTMTLFDLLMNGKNPPTPMGEQISEMRKKFNDLNTLLRSINESPFLNEDLRRQLRVILGTADDIYSARLLVEQWYNDAMERVSGWYTRYIKAVTLIVALVIAIMANADTIMIFNRLATDQTTRDLVVGAATQVINDQEANAPAPEATLEPGASATPDANTAITNISNNVQKIKTASDQLALFQIIGWSTDPNDVRSFPPLTDTNALVVKFIGLFFTTIALSLGAPFWFDVLNKITKIKSSGNIQGGSPPSMPPPPAVENEVDAGNMK